MTTSWDDGMQSSGIFHRLTDNWWFNAASKIFCRERNWLSDIVMLWNATDQGFQVGCHNYNTKFDCLGSFVPVLLTVKFPLAIMQKWITRSRAQYLFSPQLSVIFHYGIISLAWHPHPPTLPRLDTIITSNNSNADAATKFDLKTFLRESYSFAIPILLCFSLTCEKKNHHKPFGE